MSSAVPLVGFPLSVSPDRGSRVGQLEVLFDSMDFCTSFHSAKVPPEKVSTDQQRMVHISAHRRLSHGGPIRKMHSELLFRMVPLRDSSEGQVGGRILRSLFWNISKPQTSEIGHFGALEPAL